MAHRYPALVAGTTSSGAFAGEGDGAGILVPDGLYATVSSRRLEAAHLALSEAWAHRPPAYSWERAVFEKAVIPAARAELYAAWLEAAEQRGFESEPL
ncbi:hypothetical protein B5P43_31355 [Bacillus sp. SRB_336]|nr:hypothetical protein B5P43_31355 [Bacillus sp. SRB_336]